MREEILKRCELLIENRDRMKEVFSWDGGMLWLASGAMYTTKGRKVDTERLQHCKNLIKEQTGVFSNFRGNVRSAVASMIALSDTPEQMLADGLVVHKLLKKDLHDSAFLPLAAMTIVRLTKPEEYEKVVEKTVALYNGMKKEHPLLTSAEDSAFCAMLALSEKSAEVLLSEMEACYKFLNDNSRFPKNAVQSLSHVLAICDGPVAEKCEKTMELYETLGAYDVKYGKTYELPALGVLAMEHTDYEALAEEIKEVSDWLSKQPGFGLFGSINTKQRAMYAGMMLQDNKSTGSLAESTALQSSLALIVAEEAAMCAVICCTAAATAANASN